MTLEQWITAGLFLVVAVAAALALRGGELRKLQSCRLVCPLLGQAVALRIEQDVRIGRWLGVRSCSVFADPEKVYCGQECARLMNRGTLAPHLNRG